MAHVTVHGCKQRWSSFTVVLVVRALGTCSWLTQPRTVALSLAKRSGRIRVLFDPAHLPEQDLVCMVSSPGIPEEVSSLCIPLLSTESCLFPSIDLLLWILILLSTLFTGLWVPETQEPYLFCLLLYPGLSKDLALTSPWRNVYWMKKWILTLKLWNPGFLCFLLKPVTRLGTLEGYVIERLWCPS